MITVDLVPVWPANGAGGDSPVAAQPTRVSARSIREAVDSAGGPLAVRVLFPIDGQAFFADETPTPGRKAAGAARR